MEKQDRSRMIPVSAGAVCIAIGVVYGDIGTSPMYVMKSVIAGNGGLESISKELILGSLSLVIWTLTLLTTVKYVFIAMKADNHGEGGIFSLYSLVRKYGKWLLLPAMIGGAALLADGVLTPAVTVTTAIEGLRSIPVFHQLLGNGATTIVIITLVIIAALFLIQKLGTSAIGKAFGPMMMVWFGFLAFAGILNISNDLGVMEALNPIWAVRILFSDRNAMGFMILGSVFLATTGAEALYSDMGHVGKGNIYVSWPLVKLSLILNYLGQGAWLLQNYSSSSLHQIPDMNPFFQMLPQDLRGIAVVLGALAAVIASQALITGSFTLVSEASRLNLMPHMHISYPSKTKGQIFIPLVNVVLWILCSFIVLYFQTSAHMEAAYGLAITLTMLMTTLLLFVYLKNTKKKHMLSFLFLAFFGGLESIFFISSLGKFMRGGYVALFLALFIFAIMAVWHKGTMIEDFQAVQLPLKKYSKQLEALREDTRYAMECDNLVYLTKYSRVDTLDRDILYSILNKKPKRAKAYWFVSIEIHEDPYMHSYEVESYGTDYLFRVRLHLGFKVDQRLNVYLRQIVEDLIKSGELPPQKQQYSIYNLGNIGDFEFCLLRKMLVPESDISSINRMAVSLKYMIRHFAGSPAQWYGLENSSLKIEYVPLFIKMKSMHPLIRVIK